MTMMRCLSEWGDVTPKYEAFQQVIGEITEIPSFPLTTKITKRAYGVAGKLVSEFLSFETLALASVNQSSTIIL